MKDIDKSREDYIERLKQLDTEDLKKLRDSYYSTLEMIEDILSDRYFNS